ncbi:MAG: hypothetical protein ACFCUT_01700 [Kiloniellaceae bacterium]
MFTTIGAVQRGGGCLHSSWKAATRRRAESGAIRQDILVCLPDHLHPVSRMFLEHWLAGDLATAEFLRWFHMPNSAYLTVAECVLAVVAGA